MARPSGAPRARAGGSAHTMSLLDAPPDAQSARLQRRSCEARASACGERARNATVLMEGTRLGVHLAHRQGDDYPLAVEQHHHTDELCARPASDLALRTLQAKGAVEFGRRQRVSRPGKQKSRRL